MASLTLSPKLILTKIFDAFQYNSEEYITQEEVSEKENLQEKEEISKPKLQVNIDDLKVISTALLHFRRHLKRKGETDKAQEVGEIDLRFYELITYMEEKKKREDNLKKTIERALDEKQEMVA